jgi:hypothetical protein
MKFFYKLERNFGKYSIKNLMNYLVVFYVVGFVISLMNPYLYYEYMALDIGQILKGQVWRLITWLAYPPSSSIIFGLFMIITYYSLGIILENVWGSFKFNVFMFMGCLFHIIGALIIYVFGIKTGMGEDIYGYLTPDNLNLSIFLAFALTFPEMEFRLYFAIPVKAKYLAFFYILLEAYSFMIGSLSSKVTIALSLLNFIIFYFISRRKNIISDVNNIQRKAKGSVKIRPVHAGSANISRHKCAVCGKTEKDDESMEFRYCSKCKDGLEYCMDHLYTHEHVE